jgi:putative redox protein
MVPAKVSWKQGVEFEGIAASSHGIALDGSGKNANTPMELVLIALCGCTAYDVITILQKKREPVTSLEVSAEAEKAPEPPRVYTWINLTYRVGGNVARKAVDDAVRLSEEKYCSVAAMLNKSAKITYQIQMDSNA